MVVWDGGFRQAEYQLRFVDGDGKPIPGVQIRVENSTGLTFYHYPVTDYLEGRTLSSDKDGVLTFHHVNYSGIEFGGQCSHLFWLIPIGQCDSPTFICRFLANGKDIYRCNFRDLKSPANDTHQEVVLPWTWEENLPLRYPQQATPEWLANEGRASDKTFELQTAWRATTSALWKVEKVKLHGAPASEDLTFPIYRQTIVVDRRR
jgi:hypothetical protein